MAEASVAFTVFTKPWPEMPLPELAKFVKGLGFDGVELPVRPGFQVQPDNIATGLAEAAKIFGDFGLKIGSVAGLTDEKTFAACARSGVPIVRICVVATQATYALRPSTATTSRPTCLAWCSRRDNPWRGMLKSSSADSVACHAS